MKNELTIPPRITSAWLRSLGACSRQILAFDRAFPEYAEVTRDNLRIAAKSGLCTSWLCERVYGLDLQELGAARHKCWNACDSARTEARDPKTKITDWVKHIKLTSQAAEDFQLAAANIIADKLGLPWEDTDHDT